MEDDTLQQAPCTSFRSIGYTISSGCFHQPSVCAVLENGFTQFPLFGNGIVEIRMINLDTGSATGILDEMVTPRSLTCQAKNAEVRYTYDFSSKCQV
jgi:hypothetical protein